MADGEVLAQALTEDPGLRSVESPEKVIGIRRPAAMACPAPSRTIAASYGFLRGSRGILKGMAGHLWFAGLVVIGGLGGRRPLRLHFRVLPSAPVPPTLVSRHPRVHSHSRVTATGPDRHGAMRFGADVTLPLAGSKQVSNRARCSVPLGVAGATPCPQRFFNFSRGVSSFASVGWTLFSLEAHHQGTATVRPSRRRRLDQQQAQDQRRDRDWAMRHTPGPMGQSCCHSANTECQLVDEHILRPIAPDPQGRLTRC